MLSSSTLSASNANPMEKSHRLDIVLEVTPIGTITLNDSSLALKDTKSHRSSTLSASNADPMEKSHRYRNIFGAMQYATITRLDIAFSVNKVSRQLMYNPLDTHQKAVKRILSYLKLTLHMDYSPGNLKT
ncbi:hypothetical protein AAG906_025182 [Vitis piasezkii]